MRYLIIIIFFLCIGCSNNEKLQGYWYGEINYQNIRYPSLIKFEKDTYIEFTSTISEKIKYKHFSNTIYSETILGKRNFKYKFIDTEVSFFDRKTDTLVITLRRPKKSIFFEYLKDSTLIINLPEGNGLIKSIGYFFKFRNPLYTAYKNDSLFVNFLDTTMYVDSTYYKFLIDKRKRLYEEYYSHKWNNILFVADKNLKISDLNLLLAQLKIADISTSNFCLKSENLPYEDLNVFSFRLPSLREKDHKIFVKNYNNEEILLPPYFFSEEMVRRNKEKIVLVEISNNYIKVNNKNISKNQIAEKLKAIISLQGETIIYYYLDESSTYQTYVDVNLAFIKSIYTLRTDYLKQKYNLNYTGKENYKSDGKIKEVMDKYPMIISLLNKEELNKARKILF